MLSSQGGQDPLYPYQIGEIDHAKKAEKPSREVGPEVLETSFLRIICTAGNPVQLFLYPKSPQAQDQCRNWSG